MRFKDLFRIHLEDSEFAGHWHEVQPSFAAGDVLLKMRMDYGLTQQQLADKVGVKRAYIARVESGDANPTVRTLGRILAPFGLSLSLSAKPIAMHEVASSNIFYLETVSTGTPIAFECAGMTSGVLVVEG
ncbi:MAG: helix-turn-helix domain-containing protein [Chloroflexi bacterium]|nr:helix-turn-helix domain-containing protein [Chloroflexota bacterium]